MPDNRKPLIYGAFPVCRNYTVRAHLRQHAAVGGLRPERRAGVAGPLGHQDDRKHLRPSGHTPQALYRQRLGAGAAAFEAVKTKKRQILLDLTLLLTLTAIFGPSGESRTHGLLNPIQARYQNCATPGHNPLPPYRSTGDMKYYTQIRQSCQQIFAIFLDFFEESMILTVMRCFASY